MAPLVARLADDWATTVGRLPPIPRPAFGSSLHRAQRSPHPQKDPPDERRPRVTWFLPVEDQDGWRERLERVVTTLDEIHRERGGGPFVNPEPNRFFHLSLFNNRDGEANRSIGSIDASDVGEA